MSKKLKYIIPVIIVAILILAGIFGYRYLHRVQMNDTLVYGNTAGNFYNGGLFCEANGFVYFSNPQDNYKIYRMTSDGGNVTKLSDSTACFLNADSHYLYFAKDGQAANTDLSFLNFNANSLCRMDFDSGKIVILDEAPTLYVSLVTNTLYYIHYDKKDGSNLYTVGIDGEGRSQVSKEPLLMAPGQSGTLCYAGVNNDHNISLWNPETNTGSTVLMGLYYRPIDTDSRIYYQDCEDNYSLHYYDKTNGSYGKLTDCWVDCYNLTNQYAYYQKNDGDNSGLYRIRLDGSSEEELVISGIFTDISVTSQYVYFRNFNVQNSFYRTPSDAPVNVENVYFY